MSDSNSSGDPSNPPFYQPKQEINPENVYPGSASESLTPPLQNPYPQNPYPQPPPPGYVPPPGYAPPPGYVPPPPPGYVPPPQVPFPQNMLDYNQHHIPPYNYPYAPPGNYPYSQSIEPPKKLALDPLTRSLLIYEIIMTEFVAFSPGISAAVVIGVQRLFGQGNSALIQPYINGHTAIDIAIQIFIEVFAIYPVVLVAYLLKRSGESLKTLGLLNRITVEDVGFAFLLTVGVFAISYLIVVFMTISHLAPTNNPAVASNVSKAYIIVGIVSSLRTALVEEVAVCGYLLNRLEQLNVKPMNAIIISTLVRCSYHVYGGWPLVLMNIPFGIMQAYVYQKNKSIKQQVAAHFIYDSLIFILNF